MAITKKGLDYYSVYVGKYAQGGFRYIRRDYGSAGIDVWYTLMDMVYSGEGYYLPYADADREDICWDIAQRLFGKDAPTPGQVQEMIASFAARGMLDEALYRKGILTSREIQEQYYFGTVKRRTTAVIMEYWLLSVQDMMSLAEHSPILTYVQNIAPNNEVIARNNEVISQSNEHKVKQSKVEKSKVKQSKAAESKVSSASPTAAAAHSAYDDAYESSYSINADNCDENVSNTDDISDIDAADNNYSVNADKTSEIASNTNSISNIDTADSNYSENAVKTCEIASNTNSISNIDTADSNYSVNADKTGKNASSTGAGEMYLRQQLVERYGEAAVRQYEQKFEDWSCKQHKVNIDVYTAISDWMRQDKVPQCSQTEKNRTEIDKLMQSIWAKYELG